MLRFIECPSCENLEGKNPDIDLELICLTCDGLGKIIVYAGPTYDPEKRKRAIEAGVKALEQFGQSKIK